MSHRDFAAALKTAMTEEGLNQDQLAERAGVSQQHISNMLRGSQPKLDTLEKLERALPRLREIRSEAVA